ncbi:TerB family tellurite resistance protein [Aromatoleum diolicum]|nr:TerB family tellurite resistance protein [Aromatoleum diolicum]
MLMIDPDIEAQRAVATELVALVLLADGVLASRELEAMDRHGIPQLLGVSRDALIKSVIDHCRKLLQRPERIDPVRLVDIERFESMLDRIVAPTLRETVCRVMLVLAKADGVICQPEQTLLRDVLTRWGIALERLRD